jgi:hypothetical protein
LRGSIAERDRLLFVGKWELHMAIGRPPCGGRCSGFDAPMVDFRRYRQQFPNLADWLRQILSGGE